LRHASPEGVGQSSAAGMTRSITAGELLMQPPSHQYTHEGLMRADPERARRFGMLGLKRSTTKNRKLMKQPPLHPYSREMRRPDAEGARQSSRANIVGGAGGGPLWETQHSLYLPRAPPPANNANWNYRPGEYQPTTFRQGTSTSAGVYDRSSNMTGRASTGGIWPRFLRRFGF